MNIKKRNILIEDTQNTINLMDNISKNIYIKTHKTHKEIISKHEQKKTKYKQYKKFNTFIMNH